MARRDIHQSRITKVGWAGRRAFRIDGNGHEIGSRRFQRHIGPLKAGVFQQHPVPWIQEQSGYQVQSFLNSRDYYDLLCFALHSAFGSKILCQHLP